MINMSTQHAKGSSALNNLRQPLLFASRHQEFEGSGRGVAERRGTRLPQTQNCDFGSNSRFNTLQNQNQQLSKLQTINSENQTSAFSSNTNNQLSFRGHKQEKKEAKETVFSTFSKNTSPLLKCDNYIEDRVNQIDHVRLTAVSTKMKSRKLSPLYSGAECLSSQGSIALKQNSSFLKIPNIRRDLINPQKIQKKESSDSEPFKNSLESKSPQLRGKAPHEEELDFDNCEINSEDENPNQSTAVSLKQKLEQKDNTVHLSIPERQRPGIQIKVEPISEHSQDQSITTPYTRFPYDHVKTRRIKRLLVTDEQYDFERNFVKDDSFKTDASMQSFRLESNENQKEPESAQLSKKQYQDQKENQQIYIELRKMEGKPVAGKFSEVTMNCVQQNSEVSSQTEFVKHVYEEKKELSESSGSSIDEGRIARNSQKRKRELLNPHFRNNSEGSSVSVIPKEVFHQPPQVFTFRRFATQDIDKTKLPTVAGKSPDVKIPIVKVQQKDIAKVTLNQLRQKSSMTSMAHLTIGFGKSHRNLLAKQDTFKSKRRLSVKSWKSVDQEVKSMSIGTAPLLLQQSQHQKPVYEPKWYENGEQCIAYLKANFLVVKKFQYANNSYENGSDITIRLSQDEKELIWYDALKNKKKGKVKVKKLKGVIFGAFSSTFYSYKNLILKRIMKRLRLTKLCEGDAMCQRRIENENSEPFYCWECVSIVTNERSYDFTIDTGGPAHYDYLYLFINAIQTLIQKQKKLEDKKKSFFGSKRFSKFQKQNQQFEEEDLEILSFKKFRLMALRMKISYEAFLKGMTIHELFYDAIEHTLDELYADEMHYECEISDLLRKASGTVLQKKTRADIQESQRRRSFHRRGGILMTQGTIVSQPTSPMLPPKSVYLNNRSSKQYMKVFSKDEALEVKHKLQVFRFWFKILKLNGSDNMTFQEKVTDLKVKRKLLEIEKNEIVRDMALNEVLLEENQDQKQRFIEENRQKQAIFEELNPKFLPSSFKFYANPKNILTSIYYNQRKIVKYEQGLSLRGSSTDIITNNNNKSFNSGFETSRRQSRGFLCFSLTSRNKKDSSKSKVESLDRDAAGERGINSILDRLHKQKQQKIVREVLLKTQQLLNMRSREEYFLRMDQFKSETAKADASSSASYALLRHKLKSALAKKANQESRVHMQQRYHEEAKQILQERSVGHQMKKALSRMEQEQFYFDPLYKSMRKTEQRVKEHQERKKTEGSSTGMLRMRSLNERAHMGLKLGGNLNTQKSLDAKGKRQISKQRSIRKLIH